MNAGLTLYEGGKLRTAVRQQKLQNRIDALTVAESENDIRIAIVQAYLQALYAAEAVEVARNTAEVSRAQRDRAEELWKAGSISRVDLAQLESQYASDLYQVTTACSTLDNYRLQLKQLLELDITEEMNLAAPAIQKSEVLSSLPAKAAIYATALEAMPKSNGANWPSNLRSWVFGRPGPGSIPPFHLPPASARATCPTADTKAEARSGTASTRISV